VKLLGHFGYRETRQKGSHRVIKRADGFGTVVPDHRELKTGTLVAILRQLGLTVDDLRPYLLNSFFGPAAGEVLRLQEPEQPRVRRFACGTFFTYS